MIVQHFVYLYVHLIIALSTQLLTYDCTTLCYLYVHLIVALSPHSGGLFHSIKPQLGKYLSCTLSLSLLPRSLATAFSLATAGELPATVWRASPAEATKDHCRTFSYYSSPAWRFGVPLLGEFCLASFPREGYQGSLLYLLLLQLSRLAFWGRVCLPRAVIQFFFGTHYVGTFVLLLGG